MHWSKYSGKRKAITLGLSWKSGISSEKDFYWKKRLYPLKFSQTVEENTLKWIFNKKWLKYIEVNIQEKGRLEPMVYHENQGYIHKGIFIKKSKVIAFDFWSKSRRRYIEVNIQERGRL